MKKLNTLKKNNIIMKTTILLIALITVNNSYAFESLGNILDFQNCDTYLNALNASQEEVNEQSTEIAFFMEQDSIIKCNYNSFEVKEVIISRVDYDTFLEAFSSTDIPMPKYWLKRYNLLRTLRSQFKTFEELPSGDILVDGSKYTQTFIFDGQDFIGVSYVYNQSLREGMLEVSELIKKNLKGFQTEKGYIGQYNFELLGIQFAKKGCRLEANIKTQVPRIFRSAEDRLNYPGPATKIIIDFKEGISWSKPMDDQTIKTKGYATKVMTAKGILLDLEYLSFSQGAKKARGLFQRLHEVCYQ